MVVLVKRGEARVPKRWHSDGDRFIGKKVSADALTLAPTPLALKSDSVGLLDH